MSILGGADVSCQLLGRGRAISIIGRNGQRGRAMSIVGRDLPCLMGF